MMRHACAFALALLLAVEVLPARAQTQIPDLTSTIRKYATEHNFNGTVSVERNGQPVFSGSFGVAERAFNVPITNETKYRIASITKAFTAVLVLQLSEQGKINLDATIKNYLPEYAGEGRDRVTVHHLLNHTSGIPNLDAGLTSYEEAEKNGIEHYQMPFTPDQIVRKFCSGKLVTEPGKVFDYNNADYIILGKIVEKVTGKPYDEVLQEKILLPLGLKNTGMLHQREIVKDLARTYVTAQQGKEFVNDMPVYMENWYAAGGMYSTTVDLLTFSNALFGGALLKTESLYRMLKPGLEDYGYGVWVVFVEYGGKRYRLVDRPARVMGANGSLRHFGRIGFDDTLNIVILSNTNATDLDGFSGVISKMLLNVQ
jgi:D-alanyl-D-alanine carboxypeptidase